MNQLYLTVVQVAIEHNHRFLVIKRPEGVYEGGKLCFPGGKVDETDHHNAWDVLRLAAKREILEEVGLDLKDEVKYITSNYFQETNKVMVNLFHCKLDKTDLNVQPSSREVVEWFWLTADDIDKANNAPEWLKIQVKYLIQKPMRPIQNATTHLS